MTSSTFVKPTRVKSSSKTDVGSRHRLLAVMVGDDEILIRPESIRGVYQIPAVDRSARIDQIQTPEGIVPSVSLADCMARDLEFITPVTASESAAIVFHHEENSIALRVHSVSRPIEVSSQQIFPLPPLSHPIAARSFLDSLVIVGDNGSNLDQCIKLAINPMVALGFSQASEPLAMQHSRLSRESTQEQPARDRRVGDPFLRKKMTRTEFSNRGNSQLLIFSPRTPLRPEFFFRFCLPVSIVCEVLLDQSITTLPSPSALLRGYLIWRSQPVPVIDLAFAFGTSATESPESSKGKQSGRFVIAMVPDGSFVAVQTEMNIQTIKTPRLSSVDYPVLADFPQLGVFPDSSGLIVLPDLFRILNRS